MNRRPACMIVLAMGTLVLSAGIAVAARNATAPDPQKRFAELLGPYRDLADYTVDVAVQLRIPGFRVPDFAATVFYRRPDRFHIETRSFAPFPREGGLFHPLQFDPAKNILTFREYAPWPGLRAEVYRVEPRAGRDRIRQMFVWIGASPPEILQVESETVRGLKALAKPTYGTVAEGGRSWRLPERIHVRLQFPPAERPGGGDIFANRDNPFQGMRRLEELSGEGDVFIAYRNWRINRGLTDEVFQPREERRETP